MTGSAEQVTLNYATAIEPGEATVLVRTSEYGYLGEADDELDDDDELAAYPVATVEAVGDGQVVAVGDPSVPINAMIDQPDNAAFVAGLYAEQTTVAFDLSHVDAVPPLTAAVLTLQASPVGQALLGLLVIGGSALLVDTRGASIRRRLRSRAKRRLEGATEDGAAPRLSREERLAVLRDRHPDWDEDRLERVIGGFNRTDQRERTNE